MDCGTLRWAAMLSAVTPHAAFRDAQQRLHAVDPHIYGEARADYLANNYC